jgi:hypothetical protein
MKFNGHKSMARRRDQPDLKVRKLGKARSRMDEGQGCARPIPVCPSGMFAGATD